MDAGWALEQLRGFLRLHEMTLADTRRAELGGEFDGRADRAMEADAIVIESVLDRLTPRWRSEVPASGYEYWGQHAHASRRTVTLITRREELEQHLGEDAPTLDASRLHRWAWEGARSMWGSRQYAQAVVDALKKVNAEAQLKVGRRDVSETDLFNQLFSLDPPKPGKPRLRLMPDDGSDTYSSVHRGARTFAEGLFAGIRNRHSHEVTDTPAEEQHALEQLAAVSVLARWVDDAEVVTVP